MIQIKVLNTCLLSFCLILISSCNSQKGPVPSQKNAIEGEAEIYGTIPLESAVPIQDSVLQFSVMITAILEDSKGNFWFGSHGDGLCRYDASSTGKKGKEYTYFTANRGLPRGTDREFAPGPDWNKRRTINGGNQIGSIQEDKNGNIWIVNGDNNICKFDGHKFNIVHPEKESTLLTNRSKQEWEKEFDYLWLGGWGNLCMYRYDGKKLEVLNFPHPFNLNSRDGISELYKDKDGSIWLGTMESGTFRYDGKSFTRINKSNKLGICRSVFQDKTGRVWIGNNRFGLLYWEDGTVTNFTDEYNLLKIDNLQPNILETGVQSIQQDKNEDLWFGTFSDGLWRYDGKRFKHYTGDDSMPIVTVKTIYKDKRGRLWFGIGEGSVYGLDSSAYQKSEISFNRFDEIQHAK